MSLRTKLIIEGDAEGAKKAANEAQRAMGDTQRQARDYQRGAVNAARQGGLLAAANDNLAGSFRNAATSIAVIHGPLGGVASRFSATATLATRLGVAGAGMAVGIGAATFAAQRGVRAFAEYERQQLTTEQVIRATGMSAGRTAEDIERLSREIGLGTLAATNEVRAAAGQLLTFRSIAGETFDHTLRLSQDLAAVGFGSVSSSAVQLARALENPEQGLNALNRAGITFSNTQREQIRNFMETGRVADAQRLILGQVERQVGGAGAAAGGGLAGAFDTLSEQTGRWFDLVGGNIATMIGLRERLLGVADAVDQVNNRLEMSRTPAGRLQEVRAELERIRTVQREIASGEAAPAAARQDPRLAGFRDMAAVERAKKLEDLQREERGLQRIVFEQERLEQAERRRGVQTAQREASQGLIDAEIGRLREQTEALQRTELAARQLEAAKRAQVSLDSEAGQQIAALVEQNYQLEQAKLRAAGATDLATREYERGRQSVQDLIQELRLEVDILREADPIMQEMIRIRETMIHAIGDEKEEIKGLIEERVRLNEVVRDNQAEMDFQRRMVDGVIGDMRRALRNGKMEWEDLGQVALNVLDRMIDKMQNEFLDALFNMKNAAGGGGGFFSWLFGGAFGGVSAFPPAPAAPIGGGLYDRGGWTGPGGKHDVAGLVHRDEFVFSKEATRNLGVSYLHELHEAGKSGRGYEGGGFAGPLAVAGRSGGPAGDGQLTLNLRIESHGTGTPEVRSAGRDADGGLNLDVVFRELESAVAGSVSENGVVGKVIQQTFGLQRITR